MTTRLGAIFLLIEGAACDVDRGLSQGAFSVADVVRDMSALACCFLVKGGTPSEFLWALLIGAPNGIAVGFALGPAAEKGAMILSGLFAGTQFYFICISGFIIEAAEVHQLHRDLLSDAIPLVSIFLIVGGVYSLWPRRSGCVVTNEAMPRLSGQMAKHLHCT